MVRKLHKQYITGITKRIRTISLHFKWVGWVVCWAVGLDVIGASLKNNTKASSTSLLIIHPSMEQFDQLKDLRSSKPMSDLALFRQSFSVPESLFSEWSLSMGNVVYESQELRKAVENFNATEFEEATTYVRLSDPELPGPEYDVPFTDRMAIRPENLEAREAWEKMYERFRQRRMEVCGLDLEYYTPVVDDASAEKA